jgi:hypothetical protein
LKDGIVVVCEDLSGSNPCVVMALGFDQDEPIPAMTYVMIKNSRNDRRWFGIISRPALNLNQAALGPFNPISMSALHSIGSGQYAQSLLVNPAYLYEVVLCVLIDSERTAGATIRPDIGSTILKATDVEIEKYLGLPSYDGMFAIGMMAVNGAMIEIGHREYNHQILIAGTTGYGKTNTEANLIFNAQANGRWVCIFDHKPDFQDTDRPNSERDSGGEPLPNVSRYCLTRKEDRLLPGERRIRVRPSDLDIELLAATLFPSQGDSVQRDTFEYFAGAEADENEGWSMAGLIRRIESARDIGGKGTPDKRTLDALLRKIPIRWNRTLFWVSTSDATKDRGHDLPGATRRERGDISLSIDAEMQPGRTTIVRLDNQMNGGYPLFFDYVCKQIYSCKANDPSKPRVSVVVEEAQEIFNAERSARESGIRCLLNQIRKGRSKGIGYIVCVQSAGTVPEDIMMNLNTRIVHGHKSAAALAKAIEVDEATAAMVTSFGPGEAMLSIFGAKALVHGHMFQSPFELTKDDGPARQEPIFATNGHDEEGW